MENLYFIEQTASTNDLLRQMIRENDLPEGFVVQTDFQTDGKGQTGNSWESAKGENLLFSMVLYPQNIHPTEQFLLSQLVSLGLKKTLDQYVDGITIKWPNDIYWNNKKIAGILIENVLQGKIIKHSILGIGLNVNQDTFKSDAPNPISLFQITKTKQNRTKLMDSIRLNINNLHKTLNKEEIYKKYSEALFRRDGVFSFIEANKVFEAKILAVHPDGKLELETTEGEYCSYYFKEVSFVI